MQSQILKLIAIHVEWKITASHCCGVQAGGNCHLLTGDNRHVYTRQSQGIQIIHHNL